MNPMDTAPRDGEHFMALWPADDYNPEEWMETWFIPSKSGKYDSWHAKGCFQYVGDPYAPTEWRPL